jgi:predicted amidophosphoribosyltransferase
VLRVLAELRAIVVPPICIACRVELARAQEVVCPACRRRLVWLAEPLCRRCGLPEPCSRCPGARASYDRAWAPLAHEGVARTLVRALKYDARLALVDTMAAQMAAGAPPGLLGDARSLSGGPHGAPEAAPGGVAEGAGLVPVPADASRRRRKGFDHAERLAAALADRTGLPVRQCLRRRGCAPQQAGASRSERLAPDRLVIEAVGPVPPLAVLVDDVHTTGATLDACGGALREAGAKRVNALTYTRALGR